MWIDRLDLRQFDYAALADWLGLDSKRPIPNGRITKSGQEIPMRFTPFLPLAASLVLSACGGGADEQGEGVSVEDALAEAQDNGMVPKPGQYRSTQELLELSVDGVPDSQLAMMRDGFAKGAAHESTQCITSDMTREQWVSNLAESNCKITRFDTSGGELDVAMTCTSEDGINGEMTMKGTSTEESSDMVMSFKHQLPGMGDAKMRMRVKSERIGDCT
jgi:hypothetical protein